MTEVDQGLAFEELQGCAGLEAVRRASEYQAVSGGDPGAVVAEVLAAEPRRDRLGTTEGPRPVQKREGLVGRRGHVALGGAGEPVGGVERLEHGVGAVAETLRVDGAPGDRRVDARPSHARVQLTG